MNFVYTFRCVFLVDVDVHFGFEVAAAALVQFGGVVLRKTSALRDQKNANSPHGSLLVKKIGFRLIDTISNFK